MPREPGRLQGSWTLGGQGLNCVVQVALLVCHLWRSIYDMQCCSLNNPIGVWSPTHDRLERMIKSLLRVWCPIGLLSEQCHMSYRRRITMGHQTVPTTYVPDHPRMWHHSLHIPIGHQTKNSEFISLPKRALVGDQTPIGLLRARHCMSFVLRHRCQANKAT